MTETFQFLAREDATDEPLDTYGGRGDDGYVSPIDALIVINDLNERSGDSFASLTDDGAVDEPDYIDPILLVIDNRDFYDHGL